MIANLHHVHPERRREPRLRYSWEAFLNLPEHRGGVMGRMVDLNSDGAALLVGRACTPNPGQPVEMKLAYPRVSDGEFQILNDQRWATVLRTEPYNDALSRVVLRFHQRLEEAPAEANEYVLH